MALADCLPAGIGSVLAVPTPESWLAEAGQRLPDLLLDHANCELKAASTALGFIYRYPERSGLCSQMSRLAREELRHFEQVRKLLDERGILFRRLSASRYVGGLRDAARTAEPGRLQDLLMIAALIEARSCERFAALAPRLPDGIAEFYRRLLASEARHFDRYLAFARAECNVDDADWQARLDDLATLEGELVTRPDAEFRFHSGIPAA